MSKRVPKLFDIDIVPLSDRFLDETARIHRTCFPEKIESLLGARCITDIYRQRYLGPEADTYCLLGIHRPDGRVTAFVYYSKVGAQGTLAHAFYHPQVLRRHLLRRIAFSPGVWKYLFQRFARKFVSSGINEGLTMPLTAGTCVAKMLGIHPDFRFGNIGIDLMNAVEAGARQRGANRLCGLIERDNAKAERLYEFLGWSRTSPKELNYRVFGMEKLLTPTP